MELDCALWNNVEFMEVDIESDNIILRVGSKFMRSLNKYGQDDNVDCAKCVIFPKGKTTWEGFVPPCKFKDGDIVFSGVNLISIFKGIKEGYRKSFHSYVSVGESANIDIDKDFWTLGNIRLATKKEKQKLFKAIKDNGYKWNEETKTLEKLIIPKFKVGDRIRHKKTDNKDDIYEINKVYDDSYGIVDTCELDMKYQDNYELVVLNKFDIKTLKPFDKVLVRDYDKDKWNIDFFSYYRDSGDYQCMTFVKNQCIPYENNEHLLGKIDDCDRYYKTWK